MYLGFSVGETFVTFSLTFDMFPPPVVLIGDDGVASRYPDDFNASNFSFVKVGKVFFLLPGGFVDVGVKTALSFGFLVGTSIKIVCRLVDIAAPDVV